MRLTFHPQATIFGCVEGKLLAGPIQYLFDWNDKDGAAPELQGRIASIVNIERQLPPVRLELENWTGHHFTNLFIC